MPPLTMQRQYELLRQVNGALRDSGFRVPKAGHDGLLAAYESDDKKPRRIATVFGVDGLSNMPTQDCMVYIFPLDRKGGLQVSGRPVEAFVREASARRPVASALRAAVEQIKRVVNG